MSGRASAARAFRNVFQHLADESTLSTGWAFKTVTAAPRTAIAPSSVREMLRSYQQPLAHSVWLPAPGTHMQSHPQSLLRHYVRPPFSAGVRDSTSRLTASSNCTLTVLHRQLPATGRLLEYHQEVGRTEPTGGRTCATAASAGLGHWDRASTARRRKRGNVFALALSQRGSVSLGGGSDRRSWGGTRSERSALHGEPAARRSFGVLRRRKPGEDDRYRIEAPRNVGTPDPRLLKTCGAGVKALSALDGPK